MALSGHAGSQQSRQLSGVKRTRRTGSVKVKGELLRQRFSVMFICRLVPKSRMAHADQI
jgi:hypothetical protein